MFCSDKLARYRRKRQLIKLAKRCQTAEELVTRVGIKFGWEIHPMASLDFPPGVPGMTMGKRNQFLILYKPISSLSIRFTILHELVHIVLFYIDRADRYLFEIMEKPEDVLVEKEMEEMAYRLLVILYGVGQFLSHQQNSSVAARYESLMGKKNSRHLQPFPTERPDACRTVFRPKL